MGFSQTIETNRLLSKIEKSLGKKLCDLISTSSSLLTHSSTPMVDILGAGNEVQTIDDRYELNDADIVDATTAVTRNHITSSGEEIIQTVTLESPHDSYVIGGTDAGGNDIFYTDPDRAVELINTFRVDFNTCFTGIVELYVTNADNSELFGQFSSNIGKPHSYSANITPSGNGWYDAGAGGTLRWQVENLKSFTFQEWNQNASALALEMAVNLYEDRIDFERLLSRDVDTGIITPIDYTYDGILYTPIGAVAIKPENCECSEASYDNQWGWEGVSLVISQFDSGDISSGVNLVSSTYSEQDQLRKLSIAMEDSLNFEVTINLSDGTILTHRGFGTGYVLELELNEPSIISAEIGHAPGGVTTVAAVINFLSKNKI